MISDEKLKKEIKRYCKQYFYQPDVFVFKKCFSVYKSYLIILRKPEFVKEGVLFHCNESRPRVVDRDFAKFRCNGLLVERIFDLRACAFIQSIRHETEFQGTYYYTDYVCGSMVMPESYDEDISKICAGGIHYFLKAKAALYYNGGLVIYDPPPFGDKYSMFSKVCFGSDGSIMKAVERIFQDVFESRMTYYGQRNNNRTVMGEPHYFVRVFSDFSSSIIKPKNQKFKRHYSKSIQQPLMKTQKQRYVPCVRS